MCAFANGMSNFSLLRSRSLRSALGYPAAVSKLLYFVDGNTRNGSDFAEKLKYLPNGDDIRKRVSFFIFKR